MQPVVRIHVIILKHILLFHITAISIRCYFFISMKTLTCQRIKLHFMHILLSNAE